MNGTRGQERRDQARRHWIIREFSHLKSRELLDVMIGQILPGRVAVASSFGAESAVLLALVAQVDPATPVLFLETGALFPETLAYRRALQDHLGLRDVRVVQPVAETLARHDPQGLLHQTDPDACCFLRKVQPMEAALAPFEGWITGRKRGHGGQRRLLPTLEWVEGRWKINPLANWGGERIEAAFRRLDLPRHPLAAQGYASIGCRPCTRPIQPGESLRAGRWAGTGKSECGLHVDRGSQAVGVNLLGAIPSRAAAGRTGVQEFPSGQQTVDIAKNVIAKNEKELSHEPS